MGRFYWRGSESEEGLGGNIASPLSFGGGGKKKKWISRKVGIGVSISSFLGKGKSI